MSDLLIVLVILGFFIIAGVVVYNWVQGRKLREEINKGFIVPQKDVLAEDFYMDADAYVDKELASIDHAETPIAKPEPAKTVVFNEAVFNTEKPISQRSEPTLEQRFSSTGTMLKYVDFVAVPEDALAPTQPLSELLEKPLQATPVQQVAQTEVEEDVSIATEADAEAIDDAPIAMQALPAEVHPQMDLTAYLFAASAIDTKTLETMLDSLTHEIGLPMMVHGVDAEGKWRLFNAKASDNHFKQVACSLQLADRGGPVPKPMLHKFQLAVENMSLDTGAQVEWQGTGDAMQRAVALDQFCMEVDQLISVHLLPGEAPIHGTKFKGLAEASGMTLKDDGKFYYYAANNPEQPQFILIDSDNQGFSAESLRNNVVMGATFQIEIPKVANCDQVFNQMIQIAQRMANSLSARMVDDKQKPLGDLQIEKIRQQLKVIHATMLARGIMPGSTFSARLFN